MGNDGQIASLRDDELCPPERYPSDGDWQCLEERDSSGDLVARYTYAPGYIDDVAVQERDLNDDQDFGDTNEVVYYHANTLFSVNALSDAAENVLERYRYDAYGGCTVLDADGSADSDGISDVGNAYAFTGRRLDLESDLMQYRHRYYAPTLGRFVSRDQAGYEASLSLYSCTVPGGHPDPCGLAPAGNDCVVTHRTVIDEGEWYFVSYQPWKKTWTTHNAVLTPWTLDESTITAKNENLTDVGMQVRVRCRGQWKIQLQPERKYKRRKYRHVTTRRYKITTCCGVETSEPLSATSRPEDDWEYEWRTTGPAFWKDKWKTAFLPGTYWAPGPIGVPRSQCAKALRLYPPR